MKYLCLIYLDEKKLDALTKSELDALWSEAGAYGRELRERSRYLTAQALEPTRAAMTVRKRNGNVSATDGPFAETQEQLAGYVVIDARNLDDAIKAASKVPAARLGSVEVRPTRNRNETRQCDSW